MEDKFIKVAMCIMGNSGPIHKLCVEAQNWLLQVGNKDLNLMCG